MSAFTRVTLFCGAAASGYILPQLYWRGQSQSLGHAQAQCQAVGAEDVMPLPLPKVQGKPRGSEFVGKWRMAPGYSYEMEAIMVELGTPKYVLRLNKLGFETHLQVDMDTDDVLVENHTKFNGLYKREVKLFMDSCQRIERHPIDGSTIRAESYWHPVTRVSDDSTYSLLNPSVSAQPNGKDVKLAAVSDIHYEKYAKRHRVLRVVENNGKTLHVVHSLHGDEGARVQFAHRYLHKVEEVMGGSDN